MLPVFIIQYSHAVQLKQNIFNQYRIDRNAKGELAIRIFGHFLDILYW